MVSVSVFCSQPRGNVILFTTPAKPWAKFDNFSTSTCWLTGFWTEGRHLKRTGYRRFPKHTRERWTELPLGLFLTCFPPALLVTLAAVKSERWGAKGREVLPPQPRQDLRAWMVSFSARGWWQYICCPRHPPVIPTVRRCEVWNP